MNGQARQVLIVGAQQHSLGAYVETACRAAGFHVLTAGISEQEHLTYDVTWPLDKHMMFFDELIDDVGAIDHIVCTAGINDLDPAINVYQLPENMEQAMQVNVIGVVKCYEAWLTSVLLNDDLMEAMGPEIFPSWHHFAVISSNSAHIARRGSLSYCASKAALSMAVRILGREAAWQRNRAERVVYAYEPAWINGTPMSRDVQLQMGADTDYHRIPGGEDLEPTDLAALIAMNMTTRNRPLNGTCLRVDGGEQ